MTGEGAAAPPTSDPEPSFAQLPEGRLAFSDEGPKGAPALFAFPGIPGTHRDFRYLAPLLRQRLRVVRIDPPGFGQSEPIENAVASFEGRARVVRSLADFLGIDRFAVLGHSMGGGTAMALASACPERTLLLVLVASVGLRRHRGLGIPAHRFGRVARLLRVPLLGRALAPAVRRQFARRRFPGADRMTVNDLAVHMRAIAGADFAFVAQCVAKPLPPTIVAFAEDDHLVETEISEELAGAVPHARVLRFSEGGHNLQKTKAFELARAIEEVLFAQ